jgi:hypothetical protein
MAYDTIMGAYLAGRKAELPTRTPPVQPVLHSLLTTLANIDCEHELEVAKVGRSTAPASVKARVLAGINQRHRERREPYARDVAMLQQPVHREGG